MKTLFDIATDVEETQTKLEAVYDLLELFLDFYSDNGYIHPTKESAPDTPIKKMCFMNRLPKRIALLETAYETLGSQIRRTEAITNDLLTLKKEETK